jgi:GntR family transcriptional regulator
MMRTIDRNSSVPLYSQIKQILIDELQDTDRKSAPELTEASLIKRFHVSRAPIRQALKELVDEGYVVRHRAKGTFPVRGLNVRRPSVLELGGLSRYLNEQGLPTTSRIMTLEHVAPPEEVRLALGTGPHQTLLHLDRIILVNDTPLVWATTYLCTPPDFRPEKEELERTGTVFPLIDQQLGIRFTREEQNIWAAGASRDEAEALAVSPGSPVLVSVTTMFTSEGQPGGWRRAVHRPEEFKYAFGLSR